MDMADAGVATLISTTRWIRVTDVRGRFVLFEFTLGDPDLMVEMIMPVDALLEFCDAQHAVLDVADEAIGAFTALAHGH